MIVYEAYHSMSSLHEYLALLFHSLFHFLCLLLLLLPNLLPFPSLSTHSCSKKQHTDNIKTVERAKRELVRLDQQLQVSLSQYESVREKNLELNEQMKHEEMRTGSLEYSLKVCL